MEALTDPNPRIRLQAVTGLGHLGKMEAAYGLLARTADSDYTVAHIAVQALRWLKASEVCLRALDSADETLWPGALRALQSIYEPAVVDGLLQRLTTSHPGLRRGIYNTLCRLDKKEAPYPDPSMWWGTRPDTSGPIYKPERWAASDTIENALRQELITAQGDEAKLFVTALLRNKVSFPGFIELMLNKVGHDTASRLDVIAPLLSPKTPVAPDLVNALQSIAGSNSELPEMRARAFRMLGGIVERHFSAVRDAFVQLAGTNQPGPLVAVWEEFTRDNRLSNHVNDFASLAQSEDPARRILGSTVLVNILASPVSKDQKSKNSARRAINHLWEQPMPAVTLLEVIGRLEAAQLAPEVREQVKNPNQDVAKAAEFALVRLRLDKQGSEHSQTIGDITYEEAVKATLAAKGEAKAGEQLFLKQGCVLCHTVSEKEPPKGPMLGGITTRYSRLELCESILKPSAKIAQGFESQRFNLKNGDQVDGFVVKESGDSVEVRNVAGTTAILEKADIVTREKRDQSIMPEGLVANITPAELASLLAFLESTRAK
ncbi:MAG: c-type cytochrome [Verrucomicrobiota bacterium]